MLGTIRERSNVIKSIKKIGYCITRLFTRLLYVKLIKITAFIYGYIGVEYNRYKVKKTFAIDRINKYTRANQRIHL